MSLQIMKCCTRQAGNSKCQCSWYAVYRQQRSVRSVCSVQTTVVSAVGMQWGTDNSGQCGRYAVYRQQRSVRSVCSVQTTAVSVVGTQSTDNSGQCGRHAVYRQQRSVRSVCSVQTTPSLQLHTCILLPPSPYESSFSAPPPLVSFEPPLPAISAPLPVSSLLPPPVPSATWPSSLPCAALFSLPDASCVPPPAPSQILSAFPMHISTMTFDQYSHHSTQHAQMTPTFYLAHSYMFGPSLIVISMFM